MFELFEKDDFLRTLFDAIPAQALVVDGDVRVKAVNNAVGSLTGVMEPGGDAPKGGDILHCIHAARAPEGCGTAEHCRECVVRNTAATALKGTSGTRAKGHVDVELNGEAVVVNLLVSASPIEFGGEKLVIVIIENISQIVQLTGILSVCAYCRKIKDADGSWVMIEDYVRSHSEADFTHGICPDCTRIHFPNFGLKN